MTHRFAFDSTVLSYHTVRTGLANVSSLDTQDDIRRHRICELSGIDDDGHDWIAYFNFSSCRVAVWSLQKVYQDDRRGHFLAEWKQAPTHQAAQLILGASSGSLEIEEFLAATLPDWFWISSSINTETELVILTKARRKAFLYYARDAAIHISFATFSIAATAGLAYLCTRFWLGTLSLVF